MQMWPELVGTSLVGVSIADHDKQPISSGFSEIGVVNVIVELYQFDRTVHRLDAIIQCLPRCWIIKHLTGMISR